MCYRKRMILLKQKRNMHMFLSYYIVLFEDVILHILHTVVYYNYI